MGQPIDREMVKRSGSERTSPFKIGDRLFHISPCRRLSKDCAHDHLKGVICGPPTLRAVAGEKTVIDLQQCFTYRCHLSFVTQSGTLTSGGESTGGI